MLKCIKLSSLLSTFLDSTFTFLKWKTLIFVHNMCREKNKMSKEIINTDARDKSRKTLLK